MHRSSGGRFQAIAGPDHRDSPGAEGTSRAPSPLSRSPAKSRFRADDSDNQQCEVRSNADSQEDTRELPDSIISFPTQNQPVLDTTLKDMLISLRSTIHGDMMSCMGKFSTELSEVGDRVNHIETKMGEYATTINELVDAHDTAEEEQTWIKAKLADLEDRSRRNNVKVRGIPENVAPSSLRPYAMNMLAALMPDISAIELSIDRIHRLPKPSFIPENVPRDVLFRMHFYQSKEKLMSITRKGEHGGTEYAHLQFYADSSQFTLQLRRNLNTVTKALRNHDIVYKWGFPTKLMVTKDGVSHVITSPSKGFKLLQKWKILPEEDPNSTSLTTPGRVSPDWKQVSNNR